jgi:hypothetical protein
VTTDLPAHLRRRTLPEQLRYLAGKLADGTASPGITALTLQVIADEQDADWHAAGSASDAIRARKDDH